jgi:hypothetical protein
MNTTRIGILITPTTNKDKETITLNIKHIDMTELEDGQTELERIYTLLECRTIDIVSTDKGDIYIDDEGLYASNNPVISFALDNKSLPLHLAGILLFSNGADDKGNTLWFDETKVSDLTKIKDIEESLKNYSLLGFVEA